LEDGKSIIRGVKARFGHMIFSKQKILFVALGIVVALIACGVVLPPLLARSSNCGGNSAALAACKNVAICFQLLVSEHGNKPVSLTSLTGVERDYFKQISGLNWLHDAKVLVTSATITTEGRQVVAVCDKPFDNVPRRLFGKAPLTHAIAYADGTTELISTQDFRRLELTSFVDVKTIQRASNRANNSL
jgi:hypothetical protein